jgi:spectinomycin phosphotransferase
MLKHTIQEQEIIEILKTHYGMNIHVTHLITGGADINAFVYKADTQTHSYFVKFKHGEYNEINLSIISLLHDSGIKEIIYPICTLKGKLFQQLDGFSIIVYPYIDVPNGFNRNLTVKHWIQLGKTLRQIHELSVPNLIQKQLRKETYSIQWRETVRSFYDKIEFNAFDDKITKDFKLFFKQNINIIQRLVDGAEDLSKKIRPNTDSYVLCHSDVHAGNVLVGESELYIIDWDEPMMAPKERDLMFFGGGVGNVWNNPKDLSYFYEGYGPANIDKVILSFYRYERIVVDIAEFGEDLLLREQSDQSRFEMFNHFINMFDPNGVVDIALTTNPNKNLRS